MLGQFTGERKDVVDEGVHDAHGFGIDTGVRVDLLQDLVHVHVDVLGGVFGCVCCSLLCWTCV